MHRRSPHRQAPKSHGPLGSIIVTSLRKAGLADSERQAEAEAILFNGVQFSNTVSGVVGTSCSPAIHI